ncbi:MAG: FG-GAP-like repeat-containing protein [Prevotella sp.]|jgi:hypothetical protein
MRKKNMLLTGLLLLSGSMAFAQYPHDNPLDENYRTLNLPKMKALKMTNIPGAPVLSQPIQLDGTEKEIRTAKHGLVYPAVYDWNHDGKPDLLLGEFSTGKKENNIKVFLNTGSKKKPRFTGEYFYALDTKGDTITNHQWCCIGIHPRVVDITGDGIPDILSGQYNPGLVSLWRGSDKGFLPREYVPQEGYKEGHLPDLDPENPNSNTYWNYTSVGFGDYDGDGLLDLFVGGSAGMRVALNTGTKGNPAFGLRKYLRFTDNSILTIDGNKLEEGDRPNYIKTYMTPVDWDGDGVLDLLTTWEYSHDGVGAILFYRGVRSNLGLRFERPVPLFKAEDGSKALPGCQPMICVTDLNGDGVNDIVMGLSLPTLPEGNDYKNPQRAFCDSVAWQWINDMGIEMPGKDAGEYFTYTTYEKLVKRVQENKGDKSYFLGRLNDLKYLNLRHRGYVYVFYGRKNSQKATPLAPIHLEKPQPKPTQKFADATADEPLTYHIESSEKYPGTWRMTITLNFKLGWHGYVPGKATDEQGFIPTEVKLELPDGIAINGAMSNPYTGESNLYFGQQEYKVELFRTKRGNGDVPIKVHINYQACDDSHCLMPTEHVVDYVLKEN